MVEQTVRKALAMLWRDRMRVIVRMPSQRENGSTGFQDVVLMENIPCKLSNFKAVNSANEPVTDNGVAATIRQYAKVFLAPEVDVPAGSRLDVTRADGRVEQYRCSSPPAMFAHHQEIYLEVFDRWA